MNYLHYVLNNVKLRHCSTLIEFVIIHYNITVIGIESYMTYMCDLFKKAIFIQETIKFLLSSLKAYLK